MTDADLDEEISRCCDRVRDVLARAKGDELLAAASTLAATAKRKGWPVERAIVLLKSCADAPQSAVDRERHRRAIARVLSVALDVYYGPPSR